MTASGFLLGQINSVLVTTLSFAEQVPFAVASLFGFMGDAAEASVVSALQSIDVSTYARTAASRASAVTQAAVLVILFVGFLFAERIWFDIKLVNLIGDPKRAARISKIISTIIWRVNYYLFVKTIVSVITFILNFLPNVGSIIATGMVALIAHIELNDTTTTLIIVSIAGTIQFVNGNIIDPMMMGRALRLSSFGIILSLAFWGAVWGVPGMFLSVPIMVVLLVVCSQVPALRPVAILMSREGLPDEETPLPSDAQIAKPRAVKGAAR